MKNRFCSLFKNRKGAQTLEYIFILTAAVILAMVVYNFMSGGELRHNLQTKIEQMFAGMVGDGAETTTKEKEPEPDPKPDPPLKPKKEEKKEEEKSFLDNSYVQEGTDFVLDSIPIVSNLKSAYEVVSGKDIFGNELSDFDRAASGAGVFIPGAKHVKRGVKVTEKGLDLVNGVKKTDKPKKKGCAKEPSGTSNIKPCVSSGNVLRANNMNEFFKLDFGKTLKNKVDKTKTRFKGQSVYKVNQKTKNEYLKKGYGFYLDSLHYDHIEVVNARGDVVHVLNLDGTLNANKTQQALKEGRSIGKW